MWNERPLDSADINPFGTNKEKAKEETLTADSCKCPACGSNMVYEPQLESMLCKNCENLYAPDGLEPRGSLGINTEPDYIIPFKIDREQAGEIMNNWISSRKYTPRGFKTKCRLTKMESLYVPFWLLDSAVTSDITGTGKKYEGIGTKILEVTTTLSYYIKNLPFNASKKIASKLLESLEPYDFSKMVKFESKYLQGVCADKYDQLPSEMTERMRKRIDKYSRSHTHLISKQYDEYEERSNNSYTRINEVSVKYCLLPVWFMTVEYEGEEYQYAVNGQTGKAGGVVPVTESYDALSKLTGWMKGIRQWIPLGVIALLLVAIIIVANLNSVMSTLNTLLTVMIAFDIVITTTYLVLLLLRTIDRSLVRKKRQKAYDINDYDEEPGMNSYFDEVKGSNIKVNEQLVTRIVRVKNQKGKVVRENNYDF